MTKHYTDAERRAVYEESMRRLRDDPPARPEPTPKPREVRLPSFEDDIAKWKREAEEASD